MKLHFEPNLDYQHAAIESVRELFRGQEICRTEFTVTVQSFRYIKGQEELPPSGGSFAQSELGLVQNDLGIGNRLTLLDDELLANHTVTPSTSVFDAVKLMAEQNIGALLVMEDVKIIIIITERDYARKIVLMGRSRRRGQ